MYPTRDEKEKLAEMLSASYVQITRLFANQRRRIHKKSRNSNSIKEEESAAAIPIIPDIISPIELLLKSTTPEIKESKESLEQTTIENASESSDHLSSTSSTLEDENIAAICSDIADLIHVDQEIKKSLEKPIPTKKKSRKRKIRKISRDNIAETTVDDILRKFSKKEEDEKKNKEKQHKEAKSKEAEHPIEEEISTSIISETSQNNSETIMDNSLLSMVNEVVNQPPAALPLELVADVNPRLVEALNLLQRGASWTHPSILSVLIQIYQQQQQQQALQIAQQQAYLSRAFNNSFENSRESPGSEYSHSSTKSTEELMSTLSPDECLAVNVLTDLANGW
jgi:hypothetical protein